jgi:hypothetical protein
MMNRKGALSDPIVVVVGILVYIVAYSAFFFIYSSQGISLESELNSKSQDLDRGLMMRNYLRSNIDFNGVPMQISDIYYEIAESNLDADKKYLTNQTDAFFQSFKLWEITVMKYDESLNNYVKIFYIDNFNTGGFYAKLNSNKPITIQLPPKNDKSLFLILEAK